MARKARLPRDFVEAFWEFLAESRNPDGGFDSNRGSDLHKKLTAYVKAHPMAPSDEEQAYEGMTRILKAQRWSKHEGQKLLFDEYALLSYGRVLKTPDSTELIEAHIEMRNAKAWHLLRHRGVLRQEMDQSWNAFREKDAYIDERLEYFQDGDTLLDVEKRHFGYVPEDDESRQSD